MLCKKPYRNPDGMEFNCGRCMPCRINRRREWTCRAVLESLAHTSSCFLTLTYSDAEYPTDGMLSVPDYQAFLRAWRFRFGPVRYMMVGEYGGQTRRAHYHAVFFGANPSQSDVEACWQRGHVMVGTFTLQSAQYVAGYVVKKLSTMENTGPWSQRPEFLRASLRPGIGAPALDMLEELHYRDFGARFISEHRDVMRMVRIGGRLFPIGRYLTKKLRERMGLPEQDPLRLETIRAEMSMIREHPDLLADLENRRIAHSRAAISHAALGRQKEKL